MSIPRKGTVPKTTAPLGSIFRLNVISGGKPVKTVDVKPGCCLEKKTDSPKK